MARQDKSPPTLPVTMFRQIAMDYKATHGIDIRFNGGDDNPVLLREQRQWLEKQRAKLSGDGAYVAVAEDVFQGMSRPDQNAYRKDMGNYLLQYLPGVVFDFMASAFVADIKASPRWKATFDSHIAKVRGGLEADAAKIGLSLDGAAETISNLMKESSSGPIAFLRATNFGQGVTTGTGHISSAIITPDLIIETAGGIQDDIPVYGPSGARVRHAAPDCSMVVSGPFTSMSAQADGQSCGSLAVSQLKELLKNDAHQLHHDCLIISNIDGQEDASNPLSFLLLSPESLRYSQSTLFIKVARAMVAGSQREEVFEHKGWDYRVRTLMGLHQDGASITRVDGSQPDLGEFRTRWLNKLETIAMPKRNVMNEPTGEHSRNRYLAYVAFRHASRRENL